MHILIFFRGTHMQKLSLALLLTISFPATAMQETTEKALQYTATAAGSLVAGYVASCAIYGQDETNVSLWSMQRMLSDKKICTETALKVTEVLGEVVPSTAKQLAVVGATAAGGYALSRASQATLTALHHMFQRR
ncbi:hypothetical protein ACFLXW_00265 [Candidatus Dependentiae bacterium]